MDRIKLVLGCTLIVALATVQAQADVVTPALPVANSSEFADADNLVNGSGLSGVGLVEDQLHDNNENNMWQSFNLGTGTSIGEWVEFDLQARYDLSEAILWQYNGLNGFGIAEPDRELDEVEISVASDLVSPLVSIGTINMAPAQDPNVGGFNEPAQVFALGAGADDVRRIRLTINSVQGGVDDGTAGLSEVRFRGVQVPEPTSIALLAMGTYAFVSRRRRMSMKRCT